MKKLLSILISFTMILCLFSACGADKTTQEETSASDETGASSSYEYVYRDLPDAKYITPADDFAGGTGTQEDPYQIADAAQLALIQEKITDEDLNIKSSYAEAYYVLTADIDINDVSAFDSWNESAPEFSWLPIGSSDEAWSFDGTFDGNGHTISGIYINTNCGSEGEYSTGNYGLFAKVAGTVKNLNIAKAYIAVSGNTCNTGSIAGLITYKAVIENCNSDAIILCYDTNAGGIIGNSFGGIHTDIAGETTEEYPVIKNCVFNGNICQIKDGSMSFIGGIIGSSQAKINNCVNKGSIDFASHNVDSVGGIAGYASCGEITSCKNEGNLNCSSVDESGLSIAGGIAGKAFVSSTGSEKTMSRGVTIQNCANEGSVSAQKYAGGIAGQVSNDNNDYFIAISDCVNSGNVSAAQLIGGIVGYVNLKGDNQNGDSITIEKCENLSALTGNTVGGIIGQAITTKGAFTISKCTNSGNIEAEGQNCAGIVAYMLMDSKPITCTVTITDCKNDGNLISHYNCGGIVSYMDMPVCLEMGKDISVTVSSCENNGSITTVSLNGFAGGILANWGLADIRTSVINCTNSGNISLDAETDGMTDEEADIMTVSRIAGGIIGRVGKGLMLTTDSDVTDSANIQNENAILNIKNCSSTGTLSVTDADAENIKNWFGGIIGNASGEDGFSFFAENCTYSGFDRGLGNDNLPDIGTKN